MSSRNRTMLRAITPPIIVDAYRALKQRLEASKAPRAYRLSSGRIYYSGKGVGGLWEEIGQLQFNFLLDKGLQPHHKLLDIGCGSLRGGVRFAKYLDGGNYYGMDKEQWLLDAAVEVELPRHGLSDKPVHLLRRDDFDFSGFGTRFDYAIAQSVFTHLTWNSILRCLVNVERVLEDNGRLYATFFEDKQGDHRIDEIRHPGGTTTYPDTNPFHYEFDVFVELARRVRLEAQYIGEWGHPKNQVMMVFARPQE